MESQQARSEVREANAALSRAAAQERAAAEAEGAAESRARVLEAGLAALRFVRASAAAAEEHSRLQDASLEVRAAAH